MRTNLMVFAALLLFGLPGFSVEKFTTYTNRAMQTDGYAKNPLEFKAKLEASVKAAPEDKRKKAMAEISHAFLTHCGDRKVTCPKDREKVYEFQTVMCLNAMNQAKESVANILKGNVRGVVKVKTLDLKAENCSLGQAPKNTGGLEEPNLKPASQNDLLNKSEKVKPRQ